MGSEEEELGTFICKTDGACGEEGERSSNGEDGIERGACQVRPLKKRRRPMEKSITRTMVLVALHVNTEAESGKRWRGVLEVPIANGAIIVLAVKVRVMTGYLCKIRIGRTAERVWED